MMDDINLTLILLAAFVGAASPGPATLAIARTSMMSGRKFGLVMAAGVTTGSLTWSILAALGLGALMLANAWMFESIRYLGAFYLLYLAYKSARACFASNTTLPAAVTFVSVQAAYAKGLALHLTNPKAILFFGSLFAIGVPQNSSPVSLFIVICAVGLQSAMIFHGYALLFSRPRMVSAYLRTKRWLEAVFALVFGAAGLRILASRWD